MARPLRILHVTPVLGQGGAERLLVALASGSHARHQHGQEQHIIAVMQAGQFYRDDEVEVVDLGFDFSRPFAALKNFLPAVARLHAIIADRKIDVVQGWLYYGNLMTLRLADSGKPIIWSVHNSTLPGLLKKPLLSLSNLILMQASATIPAVITYCAADAQRVHERQGYASAVGRVISNGVDMERFSPDGVSRDQARMALALPAQSFLVGLFGRNDLQKNISGCLDAFAMFAEARPDAGLVLAGRGMEEDNAVLRTEVARRGLTMRVNCLGPVADMAQAYSAVDMVMLGSAYGEAMPLVLLESLACHTPIVSTNLGDIGTLPVPAHALVPTGDMAALARAMTQVAAAPKSDPQWTACYTEVRASFGLGRYAAAHSALYRELVSASGEAILARG